MDYRDEFVLIVHLLKVVFQVKVVPAQIVSRDTHYGFIYLKFVSARFHVILFREFCGEKVVGSENYFSPKSMESIVWNIDRPFCKRYISVFDASTDISLDDPSWLAEQTGKPTKAWFLEILFMLYNSEHK